MLFVILLPLAGCSGNTGTVSGTVTVGGLPLKHGGMVAFHPTGDGPTALGAIDDNGHYSIAIGTDRGIVPGEYKVTVIGYAERVPWDSTKGAPPAPAVITALKYRDPATTPLSKTVKSGSNTIDLDVEAK